MHFDDRLATVLHHRAAGERAARVQFRQLLDLLGDTADVSDPGLTRAAYRRLDALALMIPVAQRERIAGECSPRIRNPRLLAHLASAEPKIALAALSRASLDQAQWTALIPDLPVRARGLLRHRRNLPESAQALLDRLGIHDRGLPEPKAAQLAESDSSSAGQAEPAALDLGSFPAEDYVLGTAAPVDRGAGPTSGATPSAVADNGDLGALVKRIEEFQRARKQRGAHATADAPQLPLGGEPVEDEAGPALRAFLFTTDETGRIDWAEPAAAEMVVGTLLSGPGAGAAESFAQGFSLRRPVTGAAVELGGGEPVAGGWVVDGAPRFAAQGGSFHGYVGRFRRPAAAPADTRAARAADRVRQLLHELRTPVTAIQGFAEVIQQQTVGPVPHEYRALAAGIAGDAARMLAGFAEIERLALLEAGTQDLPEGITDFVTVARRQVAQLQTVLSPRVSRLEANWELREAKVPMAPEPAETLAWRFLGTIASATAAGEKIALELTAEDDRMRLIAQLPAALAQCENVFTAEVRPAGGMLGTGLLGAGFALRLARAEARAAGGDLVRTDPGAMVLTLPLADGRIPRQKAPHRTSERAEL